ncbi:hypothetical protein PVAP13_9KG481126 [Panicum virgatum]|uniref:Uncharacterized protein n=1 Tax=Panicum virgatum TaxID=38727 RepID=A0A8T0NS03_PANVG|nr:hypothetical protein PVAP13_9KG481126 [Panicum virgatum]
MDGGDPPTPRKPQGNPYPRRGDVMRKIIKDLTGGGGGGGSSGSESGGDARGGSATAAAGCGAD